MSLQKKLKNYLSLLFFVKVKIHLGDKLFLLLIGIAVERPILFQILLHPLLFVGP